MNLVFLYLLFQTSTPTATPIPAGKACVDCVSLIPASAADHQLKWVAPVYPKNVTATDDPVSVKIRFLVDKQGDVVTTECLDPKIDPRFCEAAASAVKQWSFMPYVLNGNPLSVWANEDLDLYRPHQSVSYTSSGDPEPTAPSATTKNTERPLRLRVSERISAEILNHKVAPEYPVGDARHVEGDEVLQIVVDRTGMVIEASHLQGDPLLAGAAIEAVRQWRYQPYLLNGDPIEIETTATVHFVDPQNR
jgi:TonB family protein